MSIEQAKAFIEKMKTDKTFNDEVMTIEDLNERKAHIAKAGFEFTEDDFKHIYFTNVTRVSMTRLKEYDEALNYLN